VLYRADGVSQSNVQTYPRKVPSSRGLRWPSPTSSSPEHVRHTLRTRAPVVQERVKASYRENYERLATIKRKYDPTNFFRVKQNIKPAIYRSHRNEVSLAG